MPLNGDGYEVGLPMADYPTTTEPEEEKEESVTKQQPYSTADAQGLIDQGAEAVGGRENLSKAMDPMKAIAGAVPQLPNPLEALGGMLPENVQGALQGAGDLAQQGFDALSGLANPAVGAAKSLANTALKGEQAGEGERALAGGLTDLAEGIVGLPSDIAKAVTGKELYPSRTNLIAENETHWGSAARTLVRYAAAASVNPMQGIVGQKGMDFVEDFVATHGDEESLASQIAQGLAGSDIEGVAAPATTISQILTSVEENPLGARTIAGIEGMFMGDLVRSALPMFGKAMNTIRRTNPLFEPLAEGGPRVVPSSPEAMAAVPERMQAIREIDDYMHTMLYGGDPDELVRGLEHLDRGQSVQTLTELATMKADISELRQGIEESEYMMKLWENASGSSTTYDDLALAHADMFTPGQRFVPNLLTGEGIKPQLPAEKLSKFISDNPQGFTVNPYTLEVPDRGYMVSIDAEEFTLPIGLQRPSGVGFGPESRNLNKLLDERNKAFAEWMAKNEGILSRDDAFIGGWIDPETKSLQLEISRRVDDLDEATVLGKDFDQKAMFDVERGEVIDLGGQDRIGATKGLKNQWAELSQAARRRQMVYDALHQKLYKGDVEEFMTTYADEAIMDPKGVQAALDRASEIPDPITRRMAVKQGYEMGELTNVRPRTDLVTDNGQSVRGTVQRAQQPVSPVQYTAYAKVSGELRGRLQADSDSIMALPREVQPEKGDVWDAERLKKLREITDPDAPFIGEWLRGGTDRAMLEADIRQTLGEEMDLLGAKGYDFKENPEIGSGLWVTDKFLRRAHSELKDLNKARKSAAVNGMSTGDYLSRQWDIAMAMIRAKADAGRTASYRLAIRKANMLPPDDPIRLSQFEQAEMARMESARKADEALEAKFKGMDDLIDQIRNEDNVSKELLHRMDAAFTALSDAQDLARTSSILQTLLTSIGRGVDAVYTRAVLANPKVIAENFINLGLRSVVEPVLKSVGSVGGGKLTRSMRAYAAADSMVVWDTLHNLADTTKKFWSMEDALPHKEVMKPDEFAELEAIRPIVDGSGNIGHQFMMGVGDYFSKVAKMAHLSKPLEWIGKTENLGSYMAAQQIAMREATYQVLMANDRPITEAAVKKMSKDIFQLKESMLDQIFDEVGNLNKAYPRYDEIMQYGGYYNFRDAKLTGEGPLENLNKAIETPGIRTLTGMFFLKTPQKMLDEAIGFTPGANIVLRKFDQEWTALEKLAKESPDKLTPADLHKLAYKRGKFRAAYLMMLPSIALGYLDMGNGSGPLSEEARNNFYSKGIQRKPYTIGIGDTRVSFAWAQPFAQAIGLGMDMGHFLREMGDVKKRRFDPFTALTAIFAGSLVKNSIFETTLGMWDNLKAIAAVMEGQGGAGAERFARGLITRGAGIPIAVDQLAKVIAPELREIRGLLDDSWKNTGLMGMENQLRKLGSGMVPGLAPVKLDTITGKPLTFDGLDTSPGSLAVRAWNFANPIKFSKENRTSLNKALEKYGIAAKQPPETYKGIDLTWAERNKITKLATSLRHPLYDNMTLEEVLKFYFFSPKGGNLNGDDAKATELLQERNNPELPQQKFYDRVFDAYYSYAKDLWGAKESQQDSGLQRRLKESYEQKARIKKIQQEREDDFMGF